MTKPLKDSGRGTSQDQLNRALSDVPEYIGAFASDELPPSAERPFSLIMNYGDSESGGVHWVAAIFPEGRNALYFDSYGKPPDQFDRWLHVDTKFREYLVKHSATGGYDYNRRDLQCYESETNRFQFVDVCGEWSALFIRYGSLPPRIGTGGRANPWYRALRGVGPDGRPVLGVGTECAKRDAAVFELAGIRAIR